MPAYEDLTLRIPISKLPQPSSKATNCSCSMLDSRINDPIYTHLKNFEVFGDRIGRTPKPLKIEHLLAAWDITQQEEGYGAENREFIRLLSKNSKVASSSLRQY